MRNCRNIIYFKSNSFKLLAYGHGLFTRYTVLLLFQDKLFRNLQYIIRWST